MNAPEIDARSRIAPVAGIGCSRVVALVAGSVMGAGVACRSAASAAMGAMGLGGRVDPAINVCSMSAWELGMSGNSEPTQKMMRVKSPSVVLCCVHGGRYRQDQPINITVK